MGGQRLRSLDWRSSYCLGSRDEASSALPAAGTSAASGLARLRRTERGKSLGTIGAAVAGAQRIRCRQPSPGGGSAGQPSAEHPATGDPGIQDASVFAVAWEPMGCKPWAASFGHTAALDAANRWHDTAAARRWQTEAGDPEGPPRS